jgi:hypothetical protein
MKQLIKNLSERITKNKPISTDQILSLLDQSYIKCDFPFLSTFYQWAYGKIRCYVYLSEDEWLIVFDMLAYYPNQMNFDNAIYAYGNKLGKNGFQDNQWTVKIPKDFYKRVNEYGLRVPEDDIDWIPSRNQFCVRLNGKKVSFSISDSEYQSAGIDLNQALSGDKYVDNAIFMLRYLVDYIPAGELFYPEEFLFMCMGKEPNLSLLLKLDDWIHPGMDGIDLPSQSESFKQIADAIIQRDSSIYNLQHGNTHWKNWAEYIEV